MEPLVPVPSLSPEPGPVALALSDFASRGFSNGDTLWAYAYLFGAGVLANAVWRIFGAALSGGIKADSQAMIWVRHVSTALVAGLVAKMVLFPTGALAAAELWMRLLAFAAGFGLFLLTRRLLVALAAGLALLAAALFLTAG